MGKFRYVTEGTRAGSGHKVKEPGSGHGRSKLPAHLKRLVRTVGVAEERTRCDSRGKERTRIGADTAEQIEYTPASLVAIRTERPKFACRGCQEGVVVAEPPPSPIEKGLPRPGMLAHVAVAKYDDHLRACSTSPSTRCVTRSLQDSRRPTYSL